MSQSLRTESPVKPLEDMKVLLHNSHLFWLAFSRQVDQTAVSGSLYPCIMPHASNDQGNVKKKKKKQRL
jgi:hypothetical protein